MFKELVDLRAKVEIDLLLAEVPGNFMLQSIGQRLAYQAIKNPDESTRKVQAISLPFFSGS